MTLLIEGMKEQATYGYSILVFFGIMLLPSPRSNGITGGIIHCFPLCKRTDIVYNCLACPVQTVLVLCSAA